MRGLYYKQIILFLLLSSCSASGYKPAYIISDQPVIEAEKGPKEPPLAEPLAPTIL